MAFLEWRKFSFFDVHNNADNGAIAECLQDTNVSVTTSGHSHLVLCDVTGWAHLISRSWEIKSFKAYELTVTLAQQFQHDPYLVTIGEDEPGINPLIKVWDWSRTDRHGNPSCVRVSRAVPSHFNPTPATALALHENKNLMAIGFQDGSVTLFRGDVTRQRSGKMKTLSDTGTSAITGLAFSKTDTLFIVSRASVMVYYLTSDRCVTLDSRGAAPACSALATRQLMLAAREAIFCYTVEGRGPCYALAGEKVRLDWFRTYLVITTNEPTINTDASTSTAKSPKSHQITILDIQNKFIVFSKTFDEIDAVITEWGSFYILTKSKEMIYLDEKDLQSKLSLLFKKNLYDVAIRIASSQQYDAEGLTEIYKQYGDHLYSKGDLKGAIDQYIKTIGWLETSYVICKYLESRQMEPLIHYLEALHKQGVATEEHTTLLLTCRVKMDQHDHSGELREFLSGGGAVLDFDVDVAIKVVRQVNPDDALTLAANHKHHDWYLTILLEDKKEYAKAVEYISDLEFEEAEKAAKMHGLSLLRHAPKETTEFLKRLCTDYKPRSSPLVDESSLNGVRSEPDRARPDDFIHLYVNNSSRLVELLEYIVGCNVECSELVYNALLEHYIYVWSTAESDSLKTEFESKVMKVLRDPEARYDKDQVLVVCQRLGFRPGILHLYEESKLWRAQVALYMRSGEADAALALCARRAATCPRLWLDVLSWPPPRDILPALLTHIGSENLLSPILVIDSLANTPDYTLGDVRKYLTNVLENERNVITSEQTMANKYRAESVAMKEQIENLKHSPVTFQSSRCAACSRPLELPARHFLCQHAYHQHCFESYAESEGECPACGGSARAAPPAPPAPPDTLHARAHKEPDVYAVVSEYLGRGLFNKITLVAEGDEPLPVSGPANPGPAATAPPVQNYGPGAEARLRLQEGESKQLYTNTSTTTKQPASSTLIPIPEGRMRLLEQQQYSSSLEANISKLPQIPTIHKSPIPAKKPSEPNISSAIANQNPFEDAVYDETKNPFADEEGDDPMNPFSEQEDYDKNLNPFE